MNNTEGLKQVLELTDGIATLAHCLEYRRPSVMIEALKVNFTATYRQHNLTIYYVFFQILSVLCLIDDDNGQCNGHEQILNAITTVSEKRNQERFKPIVECFKMDNHILWVSICIL